jgi:hypothetical protein
VEEWIEVLRVSFVVGLFHRTPALLNVVPADILLILPSPGSRWRRSVVWTAHSDLRGVNRLNRWANELKLSSSRPKIGNSSGESQS